MKKTKEKREKEELFLEKFIYKRLKNLNDGFDVSSIKYFSEKDFKILLKRAEKYGIDIYGIEPWQDREYSGCETFESYDGKKASDPLWYWECFYKFIDQGITSYFAASYGVPDEVLESYIK